MSVINEYRDALERLINNKPIRLNKGCSINNDTVALEAGRKRGSIKKSRAVFSELIEAIQEANKARGAKKADSEVRLKSERKAKKYARELFHNSLNRELMLIERLAKLEKILSKNQNIVQLNK